ncbi:TPA: hypothetical protein HA225_06290 [Candidatus Micrarchaeota archaeon]|nr:hypothetical protein [Candidatus Micrarchaeota archaeon]HIH30003.1 hypothetical protein [Candidatus Micrarchaeota archaeon]
MALLTVNKQPLHGIQTGKGSDGKVRDYVVKYENGKPSQVIGWHFKTVPHTQEAAHNVIKFSDINNRDFVLSSDGTKMFIFNKISDEAKSIVLKNMQEQEKREKATQFTKAKKD